MTTQAMQSLLTILAIVLASSFALLTKVIIDRVFLHSYSRFPGPLLARVTNAYSAYHAWKGDLHLDIWRCHQKYGSIVRYGPDRLLINTTTALRDIHHPGKPFKKFKGYNVMVHGAPNTFTLLDKSEHARRRRLLGPGFSNAALLAYEPSILDHINTFCQSLLDASNESISECPPNISEWCDYLFFDTMMTTSFGYSCRLLQDETHRHVVSDIRESNIRIGTLLQEPRLVIARLDKRLFPRAIAARDRFVRFVASTFKQRAKDQGVGAARDVFSVLLSPPVSDQDVQMGQKLAAAEAATLIVAGSDTSATLLTATFFYLSRHSRVYDKVVDEVRSSFSSLADIRMGTKLASCSYLRACINESLRMSPPVGSVLWREAEDQGGEVDGVYIPPGCVVGTGIYSIHHNEAYYSDPFTFRPERWTDDPKEAQRSARAAAAGFGTGPRTCLGKDLALQQTMLAIATVLQRMDFSRVGGEKGRVGEGREGAEWGRERPDEFQLVDHLTGSKNGPFLRFTARAS